MLFWISAFRWGVFLVFLAHIAVKCVFLPRQRFGWHGLVELFVLVVVFSPHSPSCVAACVVAPRGSAAAYFLSHCAHCHVCVSCSYLSFPLHSPLIPWVVFVVRMYGSCFRALLFLFRFLLRFLLFWFFLGWHCFPYVCAYKFLVFFQVNWRFGGSAEVVTFVSEGFFLAQILAFWASSDAAELSYR